MLDLKNVLIKVKKSYLLGLFTLILFLSFSFAYLSLVIHDQKNDVALVNVVGQQRILFQKISSDVARHLALVNSEISEHTIQVKQSEESRLIQIKKLSNIMKRNHLRLVEGSDELLMRIRHLYFKEPEGLHQRIIEFIDDAINIANIHQINEGKVPVYAKFNQKNVDSILNELDLIVTSMESESSKKHNWIAKGVIFLWALTLISLILFTYHSFKRISAVVSKSYNNLRREKNKVADFEYAINQHSVVFRVGLDHKIQYVNDKFCQLYRYNRQEILGLHQKILGSREQSENIFDDMHAHIKSGEVWKHELCNIDSKGIKYWLDTTIVPIKHKGNIVSYMAIQNEITEQKRMSYALGQIHSIIANDQNDLTNKIQSLLTLGSELFHLPLGIVSEVSGTDYIIKYAHSPNNEISSGDTFKLINTYCIHTLKANKPISFHYVGESEIKNHPCYTTFALESYIGCPIFIGSKRYGTLNFSSPEVHSMPFTSNEIELIQLIAQWIGNELSRNNHQQAMINQQNLMTQMSKQARIGAWEVDLVTNEIIWSDMTKEIHEVPESYQPDMLTAINFYKEGESRNKITRLVEATINHGEAFQTELELVTAKGNTIWVASNGNAIFENGRCIKLYGSFQDISEKKNIENEIIDKNRRMGLAADSSGIGVWELNLITEELKWDDWMFRLYGVKPSDFSGAYEAWQNGLHPEDLITASNELQEAVDGTRKFDTQFRVIHPSGGVRYMKADALVLKNELGEPSMMVGVNYDISDRVETEIALTKAKEAAEKASNVKNEFLASMSHEIRTPMNGVVGMLDLLTDTPLNDEQKHHVSVAKSSADSLLFLINDILDFSKIDANRLELEEIVFDINILISDFADSMMQQAKQKKLELIVDTVAVSQSLIVGDPNRIRQILTNLVSNAIKFTSHGEVLIKLSLLADINESWRLQIQVKDTGIGISKDTQDYLFESFRQVDSSTTRQFGGTGLGLAIVKKLCECMNGNVNLDSDVGKGSTFTCDIKVGKTAQIIPALPKGDMSKLSVLVVDDNQTNRYVLTKQLQAWEINVTSADSAKAALTLCENIVEDSSQSLFDVAILDMKMPQMDGAELGERLKKDNRFNLMKLVMMTSSHSQGDGKYFANLGFSAYFPKPVTSSDLYHALNIIADDGIALKNADPLITKHYIKTLNQTEKTLNQTEKTLPVKENKASWPVNSNVLLVEDNRINQMVAKGVLSKLSMPCEVAVNGQDALDKLSDPTNHFSLILMDCQMPVMDGYEATKNVRIGNGGSNNIKLPIVAMTANAMQGDREKCLDAGMDDYLTKPIDKDLLFEKLCYWLIR